MTTQTFTYLRELKLPGMVQALQQQLEHSGTYEGLAFTERLTLMLEQESRLREQRKQARLVRQARFKLDACVQAIDYQHPRQLEIHYRTLFHCLDSSLFPFSISWKGGIG